MFLEEKNVNEIEIFTPTRWQTVILRNYGLIPSSQIALTLNCTKRDVENEASRLGVDFIAYNEQWLKKSYLTIIRNNWHLLSYRQLLILLDKDEKWLNNELKNNDFLGYKLGDYKPFCDEIQYKPLTEEQKKKTLKIKRIIRKYKLDKYIDPFNFSLINIPNKIFPNGLRIAYPYSIGCDDIFINEEKIISDEELIAISSSGINALWVHGLLSKLSPYKFNKTNDKSYEVRRKNLQKFIDRANKYNIKVFLYLNEPRSIAITDLKNEYSYLIGRKENDEVALCFSFKEVQDNLYEMCKDLLNNIDGLGGFITITASENLTYCKHKLGSTCEHCKDIPSYKTAALINNIIYKAIQDSKPDTILLANLWGWSSYCGFSDSDVKKGIGLLNKNIGILCVSEFGTHKNKNELYQIDEYSISHGEPCIETIQNLKYAKKLGHKIYAKIQINNSWEMSSIPYFPVFELLIKHLEKLNKLGVNDYMLSWTLGGYPSVNANLVANFINGFNYDLWLKNIYGNDSDKIKEAIHYFSKAFSLFPFRQSLLYNSPLQIGPTNLIYQKNTKLLSTMVTYPFDDISTWLGDLSENEFITSFSRIIHIWKKGIRVLNNINSRNSLFVELKNISETFLINIQSTLNQYLLIKSRDSGNFDLNYYLNMENKLTIKLYNLTSKDGKIGFEASNQYYYSQNNFLEKLINIDYLKKTIKEKC